MSHIYVISNNSTPDEYKVGCNSGTIDDLLDNHTTSIHILLEVGNAEELVKDITTSCLKDATLDELELYIYSNGTNIGDEDMYYYEARKCTGCTSDTIVPCRGNIYIISDNSNPSQCRYKVGYNTGTKDDLIDEYINTIPQLVIHLFLEVENPVRLEDNIRETYKGYRVKDIRDEPSDWYSGIELEELELYIKSEGSDKVMFHYKLDQLDLGPMNKFILELLYNTTNGLSTEKIYITPDEYLNMDVLANLYRYYINIGIMPQSYIDTRIFRQRAISKIHKKLMKYSKNSSILEMECTYESTLICTKYKIKTTGCLYSNIPWNK